MKFSGCRPEISREDAIRLSVISYRLSVVRYRLTVVRYRLTVNCYRLSVISYRMIEEEAERVKRIRYGKRERKWMKLVHHL